MGDLVLRRGLRSPCWGFDRFVYDKTSGRPFRLECYVQGHPREILINNSRVEQWVILKLIYWWLKNYSFLGFILRSRRGQSC